MRNKRIPEGLITSPYNAYLHPNSVITITDTSEAPIPVLTSDNYSVFHPIYSPKGPTQEVIYIEGNDIVGTYLKLFGYPNTTKYGPMATWAYQSVLSRFSLGTINMRTPDSTYANVYLAFNAEKAMTGEELDVAATKTLYMAQNGDNQKYFMSFTKAEVETWLGDRKGTDTISEISLEYYKIGFAQYTVQDLKVETDYDDFLLSEATKLEVKESSVIDATDKIHMPLIAIAYRGASGYGNGYTMEIKEQASKINDVYPYFNAQIKDKTEMEYEFGFTLFDIAQAQLNYGFGDRAQEKCQITMTPTNSVQIFRSYSIARKEANKLEKPFNTLMKKIKAYMVAEIKKTFVGFNESEVESSNIKEFFDAMDTFAKTFTRNKNTEAGISYETPFSYANPWKDLDEALAAKLPFEYERCSSTMQFASGSGGELEKLLDENEFDMDATLTEEVWNEESEESESKEYKVWERLLIEVFTGVTDDSIFDPSIVRDCIVFGEDFPDSVQEAIDELTRYHEDVVNYERSRVDWTYIRTPRLKIRTLSAALDWVDGFKNEFKKNINMHPVIGQFRFTDTVTRTQEYFSAFYDYIGTDGVLFDYLTSCTPRSFASGTYSVVTKGATNSQLLVPRTSTEREELKKRDVMYYRRRSDGTYALGDDNGYNIGYDSVLKSIGSNIQFNRIMNIAYLILRDNRIINPTADELEILRRNIESAIAKPMKHFEDKVKVTIGISNNEMEAGKNVVLCNIYVTGHEYSRYNRLHMISQRESTEE